jgi:hypothetical protein
VRREGRCGARGGAARGAVRREGWCAAAAAARFKTSQPRTCLHTNNNNKMSDTSESAACQHEIKSARILLYTEETAAVARVLPEKNLSRPRKERIWTPRPPWVVPPGPGSAGGRSAGVVVAAGAACLPVA